MFAERLKELIDALGMRQNSFAEKVGCTPTHVGKMLKGQIASNTMIIAISCVYRVNRRWLETGEGEMFSGENDPFLAHKSESELILSYQQHLKTVVDDVLRLRKENAGLIRRLARQPEKPMQVRDEPLPEMPGAAAGMVAEGEGRIVHIPIFDVAAAAGLEAFVSDEPVDGYLAYPEEWVIAVLGSYPQNLVGLRVEGDSMAPQLVDGTVVLVDRVQHETRLVTDGVYVFRHGDDLLIKHLRQHTGGGIEVISYNPDFKSYIINPTEEEQGEAVIIGTVIWPQLTWQEGR